MYMFLFYSFGIKQDMRRENGLSLEEKYELAFTS